MKISPRSSAAALLVAATLIGGCHTAPGDPQSHWNVDSVPRRVTKAFTGYRGPRDGTYMEYQWRKKRANSLTLRRHFLNNNPTNPFQVHDPSWEQAQPEFGLLMNPLYHFHVDSVVWGLVLLGTSGAFIPLPVDSLITLFTPFEDSIVDEHTGGWDNVADLPPPPQRFQVKNR